VDAGAARCPAPDRHGKAGDRARSARLEPRAPRARGAGARVGSGREADLARVEYARFHLFDSATTFLKSAAAASPLSLVLDDLRWADTSSLLLLQFLAHELRDARILVVATYREAEVRLAPAVSAILGTLARDGHHIPLVGLAA
jgi:hypothetical protein